MRRVFLAIVMAALPIGSLVLASCGGHVNAGSDATVTDSGVAQDRIEEPYFPEASCFVRIDSPPLLPANHVPIGSDITTWNSNPPSSGDHYPIWAAYQEYDSAVPRGYYVHDLEHGAIDFLYDCDLLDGGTPPSDAATDADPDATVMSPCDAIVQGMRDSVASIPDDPLCDPSVRVRHVITPDPLIQYPVAAAAWGWTYNAACIDVPTLKAFANAHYGQGPEDFCTNGTTGF
jgi:hypothetical protein